MFSKGDPYQKRYRHAMFSLRVPLSRFHYRMELNSIAHDFPTKPDKMPEHGGSRTAITYSPGRGGIATKLPGFSSIASLISGCAWKNVASSGCFVR